VVLIGHGGGGSSAEGYVVALGRALARTFAITSIAIDGPVHGRRRGTRPSDQALVMLDFSQVWASDPTMTDAMVADWRHVLAVATDAIDLGTRPIGWWGLSMGTILGLPVVAAEPRIAAAVLGLAGVIGPTASRLALDAASVTCPTLFLAQRDDELFGFEPVVELYDAVAATDKQLRVSPGTHAQVSVEAFAQSMDFLDGRLRGRTSPSRPREA
jgi:pimeloyl-ACP methyl ester carboxylesterase